MTDRFTDEQLREWLYDAQYDYEQDPADYNYDFDAHPMPKGTFPKYYSDDYNSTLAVLFSEILNSRQELTRARRRIAAIHKIHFQYLPAARDFDCCAGCNRIGSGYVPWPCDTYKAITGEADG